MLKGRPKNQEHRTAAKKQAEAKAKGTPERGKTDVSGRGRADLGANNPAGLVLPFNKMWYDMPRIVVPLL